MDYKKVSLEDRALLERYLSMKKDRCCDMTFANIYLWSRQYPTEFEMKGNCLVFRDMESPWSFSFPYGAEEDQKETIELLERQAQEEGHPFRMHLVTPSDFEKLECWYPGKYKITYVRDVADYVYETEKLISLSGKKYHGKKNHVNKFKNTYPDWSYEKLTDENVEDCFQMALKWRTQNGCEEDEEKRAEMCVTLNALRLYKELHLTGGVLLAEGRVVAFTLGEKLNPDMFVVHIEKAFADVPGAYPMINQQFLLHEAQEYLYVNREDDAGTDGLRKAKESYRPVFLMEKGIVTH